MSDIGDAVDDAIDATWNLFFPRLQTQTQMQTTTTYTHTHHHNTGTHVHTTPHTSSFDGVSRCGAALGTGAVKLGKKAAQSEVGRSAGRAAVAGATEGVKQDLTNRYFTTWQYSTMSTPQPIPAPQPKTSVNVAVSSGGSRVHVHQELNHESAPQPGKPFRPPPPKVSVETTRPPKPARPQPQPQTTVNVTIPSENGYVHVHQETVPPYEQRPPKPSIFSKPHAGKRDSHQAAAVRQSSRDRMYKYNLSKQPKWEERMLVQALYNFKSERKCDLEFRKGQVIEVLTRTDNQHDWWEGQLEGRVGIFPANYVKLM